MIKTPIQAVVVDKASAEKSDTRRDWALMVVSGGGMAMTAFAAVCLYLVSAEPQYVFYLGLAAMIQIFVVFTGLLGLLVKRSLKISKTEVSVIDHDEEHSGEDLVNRQEVKEEVSQAVEETPAVDVPSESENGSTNK